MFEGFRKLVEDRRELPVQLSDVCNQGLQNRGDNRLCLFDLVDCWREGVSEYTLCVEHRLHTGDEWLGDIGHGGCGGSNLRAKLLELIDLQRPPPNNCRSTASALPSLSHPSQKARILRQAVNEQRLMPLLPYALRDQAKLHTRHRSRFPGGGAFTG
jgi:hypothetical protein